ncbi:hypothetical protein FDP22_11785 [Paroceanicella profunda]|uniref:Uncharacterized protein n=1 Tax=Paroceanicella profunda TaxID=2579971 RepID=A0A5B8FHV5_9RHOB|nr:hypothetical protein [Paroceanicella profunda]QDL92398.1 hypothetical protein FDP22_11785 [Paroceanicella profunda]
MARVDRPSGPGLPVRGSSAVASLAPRIAAGLTAVWLVTMLAYALGFFGAFGGEGRPVLFLDVALFLLAAVLPPVLIWLATLLVMRADSLLAETRSLARALHEGGAGRGALPVADEMAAALVQAARLANAEEREELRDAIARLEAQGQAEMEQRAAILAEARATAAERSEIRAAIARMGRSGAGPAPAAPEVQAPQGGTPPRPAGSAAAPGTQPAGASHAAASGAGIPSPGAARAGASGPRSTPPPAAARASEAPGGSGKPAGAPPAADASPSDKPAFTGQSGTSPSGTPARDPQDEDTVVVPPTPVLQGPASFVGRDTPAPDAVRGTPDRADGPLPEAARSERPAETAAALSRMEASVARLSGAAAQGAPLSSSSARVREDIRAALSRIEGTGGRERAGHDGAADLGEAEARAARAEMRRTLAGMQDVASATAADPGLPESNRAAAAMDGERIASTLEALDSTPLGTVAEERARMAETLARLEAEEPHAEEASPTAAAVLASADMQDPASEVEDPEWDTETGEETDAREDASAPEEEDEEDDQASLPLASDPDTPMAAPIDWTEMLIALNFPMDEADSEGFTAMKHAMRDHQVSQCLRAAEDVLTLLSQDGIYMDDLIPDTAAPALWQAFARGTRGPSIAGLGAIRDDDALAASRERSRRDPIFRDATLHFLRRFDVVLRRMCLEARDDEIAALSSTRTGRAFMLLARVHGAFD